MQQTRQATERLRSLRRRVRLYTGMVKAGVHIPDVRAYMDEQHERALEINDRALDGTEGQCHDDGDDGGNDCAGVSEDG